MGLLLVTHKSHIDLMMAHEKLGDHQGFVLIYVVNIEIFERISDFRGKFTKLNVSSKEP